MGGADVGAAILTANIGAGQHPALVIQEDTNRRRGPRESHQDIPAQNYNRTNIGP